MFHRGYVLVSQLYFAVVAELSGAQLLVLGTVVSVTMLLAELPTGVWSDTASRKWPIVVGHGFLAAGMLMTGLVTTFPLLVVTQVLWGVGWACCGGADVAWLTDELARPDRIARVLTARARWDLLGQAAGMVGFGVLGWATDLATAILVSGTAMALLGGFVAIRFTEHNFIPTRERRWSASLAIVRQGLTLARRDREVLLVLGATLLVNAPGAVSWLYPQRLVALGFPGDPVLWYTAVGILSYLVGVGALRLVEARIDDAGVAKWAYAVACVAGTLGLLLLAFAPNALVGSVGVLLAAGIAANVTRAVSVLWVNRRTSSQVRATVHSLLSQAETFGKTVGGLPLAGLAQLGGSVAFVAAAVLHAVVAVMVGRARPGRDGFDGS